jgi:hypothetical protein
MQAAYGPVARKRSLHQSFACSGKRPARASLAEFCVSVSASTVPASRQAVTDGCVRASREPGRPGEQPRRAHGSSSKIPCRRRRSCVRRPQHALHLCPHPRARYLGRVCEGGPRARLREARLLDRLATRESQKWPLRPALGKRQKPSFPRSRARGGACGRFWAAAGWLARVLAGG